MNQTQDGPREWFDALAHTLTIDGDWPRCAECGECGSHEEHQPEALTEQAERSGFDADVSTDAASRSDESISAPMVAALENAWTAIRARHPEVPVVVIVLGGGSDGRPGTLKLGHFAALRWMTTPTPTATDGDIVGQADGRKRPLGEVFVGGEGLALGPVDVLGTLLHEAAHALADVRGIKDTSRQGRWHNARFKALAEELGIEVSKDPKIGWSPTTVTDNARGEYAQVIDELGRARRMQRVIDGVGFGLGPGTTGGSDGDDDPTEGDDEGRRRTPPPCVCGCGRRIRVAPTVLAAGPIVCGICEQEFRPEVPDNAGEDQPGAGDDSGHEDALGLVAVAS